MESVSEMLGDMATFIPKSKSVIVYSHCSVDHSHNIDILNGQKVKKNSKVSVRCTKVLRKSSAV